ncbi:hypothetical protein L2E82_48655 [Cichorium intybus]|uniref:Uncharacterized protein n=1 Tax=Cichorium intybus TaxID=13427 RepID=A0ACB8YZ22_CICIN|nr:hypothetical protein L2E82_48655 [Cichorium intybus]
MKGHQSAQPQLPNPHHELPVGSKEVTHSIKSKNGSNPVEKEVPDLNDFFWRHEKACTQVCPNKPVNFNVGVAKDFG